MSVVSIKPEGRPSGYRFVAKGQNATIYLYGIIDSMAGFFGDGVTAKMIAEDLKKAGNVKNIDVRVNSPGGDVFEGRAIYTLLRDHGAKVTMHVDAEASSIASLIAMAGDEIRMAEGSIMMIHCAWGRFTGNAMEMHKQADLLDTVDQTLCDTYASRSKQDAKKIKKWMEEETYMTAQEAVDLGFADMIAEPMKVAALAVDRKKFGFRKELPTAAQPNKIAALAAIERMRALAK
jgi:ATP-dependent Clp endopeptidase proteolytic subunit ClpP